MTSKIMELKELFYLDKITHFDYILQYRLLRNEYKKPDLNWFKDADRVLEIKKSPETISQEIEMYLRNKNLDY
jgi:hypothetical protein